MVIEAIHIDVKETAEDKEFHEDVKRRPLHELIRKYLGQAFKYANAAYKLKREDIARELSERQGKNITVHTLNKWTRMDGDGLSFPYEMLEDIVEITGYTKLLLILPLRKGFKVLTKNEAQVWEYYLACAKEEQARLEREMRETQVKMLKGIIK